MTQEELQAISKEVNDLLVSKGCALRVDHNVSVEEIKKEPVKENE